MRVRERMKFVYRGMVERFRSRRYWWSEGWSMSGPTGTQYPWMTRRECRKMASDAGMVAEFVRA